MSAVIAARWIAPRHAEVQSQHAGQRRAVPGRISAEQLRQAMREHGVTRERLAADCSVSASAVRRWTRYGVPARSREINAIMRALPTLKMEVTFATGDAVLDAYQRGGHWVERFPGEVND